MAEEFVRKSSVLSILRWRGSAPGQLDESSGMIAAINDIPAEDVVPVVRCKDCKYYDGRPCGVVNYYNSEDDFCSLGELKDG